MLVTNRQNITHRTPCAPQGASERPVFSTVHVKTRTDVLARPQAGHSRITTVQGVTTPSQGPYRLSHALTGAWTYRMTPCRHGATDLQNVTTPSQHHSLTWRHLVLIKSQLYDITESSQGHSSTGCHHDLARKQPSKMPSKASGSYFANWPSLSPFRKR